MRCGLLVLAKRQCNFTLSGQHDMENSACCAKIVLQARTGHSPCVFSGTLLRCEAPPGLGLAPLLPGTAPRLRLKCFMRVKAGDYKCEE